MIPRFPFSTMAARPGVLEIGHISMEIDERELRRITDYHPFRSSLRPSKDKTQASG
jgi:hypothetical protein